MDRGGTGLRWAELGVEGAESGVEGAGSGSRGSGDRGGGKSGKIRAGNCFFLNRKLKNGSFRPIS